MADPITMMAIGAGVGALKGAVTGGNPFKEALIGGTIGGLTGGAGQALGLGGAAAGTAKGAVDLGTQSALGLTTTGEAVGGTGTLLAKDIGAGFGYGSNLGSAASYLPTSQAASYAAYVPEVAASSTAIPSSLIDQGVIRDTNFLATKNIGASALENPYYAGNEVIKQAIEQDPTLLDKIKPYANIQNLSGAMAVSNQFKPTPRSPAPQGNITQGRAPQGGIGGSGVEGLLAELQKRQQYQPISLL